MTLIRNRYDMQEATMKNVTRSERQLPNFFNKQDEINPAIGMLLSLFAHVVFALLMIVVIVLQNLIFPHLPKPELPKKDIEFKLVQNESKPPINKNTKIRADRDSQAGGKHDPKRAISEPSSAPSAPAKKVQAPKKNIQTPKKVAVKPQSAPQPKQVVKPQVKPKPVAPVAKPTPLKAPVAAKPAIKPALKPSGVSTPSAPKIVSAPKSPFQVAVPTSKAPVGATYKPAGMPSTSGNAGVGKASAAPSPKFSSSGSSVASSGGSSGGKYASRGSSGGYGVGGNPSPGNPSGAPGIDAIRQPDWGAYMNDLQQRIKKNWSPPKSESSNRIVVAFQIARDGRLISCKVIKSSGVSLADRAAMSAIELTAPFRPLPVEFKGQSVPVEFTFDHNVLNSVLK